jgi:hypothetical protein
MTDFQQSFPGSRVESAKFSPSVAGGALFAYIIVPGGSMFAHRRFLGDGSSIPDAKRGNLLCVRNDWVFVLSVELAERVLERSSYHKTTAEEDELLRQRLIDLFDKMAFIKPAAPTP